MNNKRRADKLAHPTVWSVFAWVFAWHCIDSQQPKAPALLTANTHLTVWAQRLIRVFAVRASFCRLFCLCPNTYVPLSGSIIQMSSGSNRPLVIMAPSPARAPPMMKYTGAAVGVYPRSLTASVKLGLLANAWILKKFSTCHDYC